MKKLLSALCFAYVLFLAGRVCPQEKERLISQEINNLVTSDADISYRWHMKTDFLKGFLYAVDVAHIVAGDKSLMEGVLDKLFYNLFTGDLLRSQLKDLIFLSQKKAPHVNKMVKELAEKSGVPAPPIFLTRDEDFFNAAATSFSHNRSMIILGKKLVDVMSDKEIKGVLAHEIGHIKYHHIPERLFCSGIFLASSALLYHALSKDVSYQSNPVARNGFSVKQLWKSLESSKATIAVVVLGVFYVWLSSLFSRAMEHEADQESIAAAGPEAFVAGMQALKSYVQGEMKRFEQEYEFCKKQVEMLRDTSPDDADSIDQQLEFLNQLVTEKFADYFDTDGLSHPALNDRIERGEKALEMAKVKSA